MNIFFKFIFQEVVEGIEIMASKDIIYEVIILNLVMKINRYKK